MEIKGEAEVEEKWPELSNHARHWGFYKSVLNVNDKIYDANDSFIGPGQTEENLTLEPWKWPWRFLWRQKKGIQRKS